MAKLNGVKTVSAAEAIEYNGVQYGATAEKAAVGDIIRFEDRSSYVTRDAFYEIVRMDSANDPQIIDEDGDEFDLAYEEYTTFKRKVDVVTEQQTEYTEVKRKAKVGEKIKITDPEAAIGYRRGSILTVTHDTGHCGSDSAVRVAEVEQGIFHREYVVLEPANIDAQIAQKQSELAELERKKAESGRLKVGDYAKVIGGPNPNVKLGDIVVIRSIDRDGYCWINDIEGKEIDGFKLAKNVVRATDEEVAAAKAALDPRSKFAVGDKVRLISGGNRLPLNDYPNGQVYEVADPKPSTHSGTIRITGGGQASGYAKPEQLEKLTTEEAAEIEKWAKIGRKVNEYKAGDIIEVTRYQSGAQVGTIATVIETQSTRVRYSSIVGTWLGDHGSIKLTAPVEALFTKATA